jgi:ABC-type amino acid transport substrate-binding protein
MLVAMIAFSLLLWFVERKVNRAHFGGHPVRGFGSALWFAAVTMTTVGYGDKTPQTASGRVLVFFWMLFGVVAISVFTGTVASSIAITHLDNSVASAADLAHHRNGVLADSLTQTVLSDLGIPAQPYPTVEDGLRALEAGAITAFVGNEATLRYMANHSYSGRLTVAPIPNTHVSYAFVMRPDLRDATAIDAAIIAQTARPGWSREEQRYIGPPAN